MAPTLNQKVVIWARGMLNQQVERGECWDLPDQALRKAGAKSSTTTGPDDDYVWGEAVALKDVVPGDILQFRDFDIVTETEITITFEDGSGTVEQKKWTASRGHHSAIVEHVLGAGALRILEQHVKPLGPKVQLHTIQTVGVPTTTKTTKETKKHKSGRMQAATVVTTTTITVSGDVKAYRPQPQ
jgi:hypothetical protein